MLRVILPGSGINLGSGFLTSSLGSFPQLWGQQELDKRWGSGCIVTPLCIVAPLARLPVKTQDLLQPPGHKRGAGGLRNLLTNFYLGKLLRAHNLLPRKWLCQRTKCLTSHCVVQEPESPIYWPVGDNGDVLLGAHPPWSPTLISASFNMHMPFDS